MADEHVRIVDLEETSSLGNGDYLMSDNASTGTKKISYSNLLGSELNILSAEVQSLDGRMDTAEGDIDNLESAMTSAQGNISSLQTALAGKQDTLTFDNVPTSGSSNPVKSGGVYSELETINDAITTINDNIDTIETGYNPDLKAGCVMGSEPMQTDTAPYLMKVSPYNRLDLSLTGGTVAWNQLVETWRTNSASVSVDGDVITITPIDSSNRFIAEKDRDNIAVVQNHVYLQRVVIKSDGEHLAGFQNYRYLICDKKTSSASWTVLTQIAKASDSGKSYIQLMSSDSAVYHIKNDTFNLYDLTQTFGGTIADYVYSLDQANIGAGLAFLQSCGFFTENYYPYDSGTLQSVKTSGHKTVGFNQWDGVYEDGELDANGNPSPYSGRKRSKNFIPVLPSKAYYHNQYISIFYYNADKQMIWRIAGFNAPSTFTTPSECRFIKFFGQTGYNNFDPNNVCINISDPPRNGEYEPYEEHVYPLDNDLDLRGIPKIDENGNLYYDGDIYESNGSVTRRFYETTYNGSEGWLLQSVNSYGIANFYIGMQPYKQASQAICSRFQLQNTLISQTTEEGFLLAGGSTLYIRIKSDTASTVSAFKTWLQNNPTTVVYELATPTTESADAFENPQITTKNGTEEFIDERTVPIPVGNTSTYYWDMTATDIINYIEELTQPDHDMIADSNIASGKYFMVGNTLYLSTAAIAQGAQIIVGTNCQEVSLAEALNTINA